MLVSSDLDLAGSTPLIRLNRMSSGNVLVKADFLNPGGRVQGCVAEYIIESAEKQGKLRPGMTIIEATSGNTGIELTLVGTQKGYGIICVMPENVSEEGKKIIRALGGEIIFSPAEESLIGSLRKMKEIIQTDPERYFDPNQFSDSYSHEVHYQQTAPEIWQDTNGEIDIFVAGVGSGGTLQGIGKFLKEKEPGITIVAVEPKNGARLLGKELGLHDIHHIGDGLVPNVLDVNLVDMIFTVSDEEAIKTTRRLSREEGLSVGISSGANVFAALRMDNGLSRVVTILPDRAERYFSTSLP